MSLLARFRDRRRRRILRDHPIDDALWRATLATLPLLQPLDEAERHRLRELATLFLHAKRFSGAHDLVVDAPMRVTIAAQACLPVLRLGFDWLDGWTSVILYAESFFVDREEADEAGVVHSGREERAGEAWHRGPMVLSWADACAGSEAFGPGTNVVIHEIAHKLDMRDGDANGCPPLHRDMDGRRWREAFARTYDMLCDEVDRGIPTWIDPYAAETPGEFFAVISEHFFVTPRELRIEAPEVYAELCAFYRRDPAAGLPPLPPEAWSGEAGQPDNPDTRMQDDV